MFNSIEKDFDIVINCSCEHMFSMWKFREINEEMNPIYVLQSSNDDTHDEHINCVTDEEELINFCKVTGSGGPDIPATHPVTLKDCKIVTISDNISVKEVPKTIGCSLLSASLPK